jgi:hypothetical protein
LKIGCHYFNDTCAWTPNSISLQSLQCNFCYAIFAMLSLLYNLRNAIFAMQSLQCNRCNALFAMQSLLCTLCNAIFATGLPWGSRIIRNRCPFWGHLLRSALGQPGATWGYLGLPGASSQSLQCYLCYTIFAMQSSQCNLCCAIFATGATWSPHVACDRKRRGHLGLRGATSGHGKKRLLGLLGLHGALM